MIHLAVADDHLMFASGIASFLNSEPGYRVLHVCTNGLDVVSAIANQPVDVLLVDMAMPFDPKQTTPGEFGGIQTADKAISVQPNLRIIVLSMHVNEYLILSMLDRGVSGYLQKNSNPNILMYAITSVNDGNYYFNELITPSLLRERIRRLSYTKPIVAKKPTSELSERELEILLMICDGKISKEIADKLHISEGTVAAHRNNIFTKLGIRNQAELVAYAFRAGWVQ